VSLYDSNFIFFSIFASIVCRWNEQGLRIWNLYNSCGTPRNRHEFQNNNNQAREKFKEQHENKFQNSALSKLFRAFPLSINLKCLVYFNFLSSSISISFSLLFLFDILYDEWKVITMMTWYTTKVYIYSIKFIMLFFFPIFIYVVAWKWKIFITYRFNKFNEVHMT